MGGGLRFKAAGIFNLRCGCLGRFGSLWVAFWVAFFGFWEYLIGKYENASGFLAAGILVIKGGCPLLLDSLLLKSGCPASSCPVCRAAYLVIA